MVFLGGGQGRIQRFWEGGVDQKVGFIRYEENIKNALKWRKLEISTFISKKVVCFIRKSYLNLKVTNYICFIWNN